MVHKNRAQAFGTMMAKVAAGAAAPAPGKLGWLSTAAQLAGNFLKSPKTYWNLGAAGAGAGVGMHEYNKTGDPEQAGLAGLLTYGAASPLGHSVAKGVGGRVGGWLGMKPSWKTTAEIGYPAVIGAKGLAYGSYGVARQTPEALKAWRGAGENVGNIAGEFKGVGDTVNRAVGNVQKATEPLPKATESLANTAGGLNQAVDKVNAIGDSDVVKSLTTGMRGLGRLGESGADVLDWGRNNAKAIGGVGLGAMGAYGVYRLLRARQENAAKQAPKRGVPMGPGVPRRRQAKVTLRKPGQYNIYMDPDGKEDEPTEKAATDTKQLGRLLATYL